MGKITDYATDATPTADDVVLIVDMATNSSKKATLGSLATVMAASLPNGSVSSSALAPTASTLAYAEANATVTPIFSTGQVVCTLTFTVPAGVTAVVIEGEIGAAYKNAVGPISGSLRVGGTAVRSDTKYESAANLQLSFLLRRRIAVTPGASVTADLFFAPTGETGTVEGYRSITVRPVA